MMSLLLSSVSASAIIAGGGGAYPSAVTLTLLDSAQDTVNSSSNWNFDFTVADPGNYIVVIFGGTGGAGSSDSGFTNFTVDNGGTLSLIAWSENTDYEITGFWHFLAPTAGTYSFSYDQNSNRFRIRSEIYSASPVNWSALQADVTSELGSTVSTSAFSFNESDAYISVFQHRDLTNYTASDPNNTNAKLADTLLESSDFYAESNFGNPSVAGSYSASINVSSLTNRSQAGLLKIPYLTEAESVSVRVLGVAGWAVTGGRFNEGVAVQNSEVYALFGPQRNGNAVRVENAVPYVIVEP